MGKWEFLWANHYTEKIICFCVHSGAPYLIYPGTFLYELILWMHLEKNRTYARTFPVQRKEIDFVEVRFTMMYYSRKLNNKKVITIASNFWRQIACSFQVYGRTSHHNFCAKSTRKTLFWILRFFSPDQHWRHKLFLPTIFPMTLRRYGPKNSNFKLRISGRYLLQLISSFTVCLSGSY